MNKPKSLKEYRFEISCKSKEDFELAIKVAKENERERIVGMIEKLPTEDPERESDEYDRGRIHFKQDIINILEEV